MGKNFAYNLFISVLNALFSILTFRYAAEILGPEGIGVVQFSISFAEYFALIAALGIPVYGITVIAKNASHPLERAKAFTELLLLSFLSSMAVGLIYLVAICTIDTLKSHMHLHLIAGILVFAGFTTIDWLYFGLEKFKTVALRSAAIKIMAVLYLLFFVRTSGDLVNYLCFSVFGILGNNVLSFILLRKHTHLSFKQLNLKRHLRPALYILGSSIAINIYALWDTVLLGFLSNATTVGIYYAAVKIVKFAVPFIISLGTALIPMMSKNFPSSDNKGQEILQLSFDFTCLITVPLSIGLFVIAPEIIVLLSGKEFLPALMPMRVLAILPIIIGLSNVFSLQILIPAGLNRKLFTAAWAAAISSLILNFILIPIFGAIGASFANVTAELISAFLLGYAVHKYTAIRFNWNLILKAFCSCLLFIPTIFFVRNLCSSPLTVMIFSAAGCAFLYIVIQWVAFKNQSIWYVLQKIKQ